MAENKTCFAEFGTVQSRDVSMAVLLESASPSQQHTSSISSEPRHAHLSSNVCDGFIEVPRDAFVEDLRDGPERLRGMVFSAVYTRPVRIESATSGMKRLTIEYDADPRYTPGSFHGTPSSPLAAISYSSMPLLSSKSNADGSPLSNRGKAGGSPISSTGKAGESSHSITGMLRASDARSAIIETSRVIVKISADEKMKIEMEMLRKLKKMFVKTGKCPHISIVKSDRLLVFEGIPESFFHLHSKIDAVISSLPGAVAQQAHPRSVLAVSPREHEQREKSRERKTYYCLITEYCDGGDLMTLMHNKPRAIDKDKAIVYCFQLFFTLHQLHQRNIVHQDLHERNVVIKTNDSTHAIYHNVATGLVNEAGFPRLMFFELPPRFPVIKLIDFEGSTREGDFLMRPTTALGARPPEQILPSMRNMEHLVQEITAAGLDISRVAQRQSVNSDVFSAGVIVADLFLTAATGCQWRILLDNYTNRRVTAGSVDLALYTRIERCVEEFQYNIVSRDESVYMNTATGVFKNYHFDNDKYPEVWTDGNGHTWQKSLLDMDVSASRWTKSETLLPRYLTNIIYLLGVPRITDLAFINLRDRAWNTAQYLDDNNYRKFGGYHIFADGDYIWAALFAHIERHIGPEFKGHLGVMLQRHGVSAEVTSLVTECMKWNSQDRISAKTALSKSLFAKFVRAEAMTTPEFLSTRHPANEPYVVFGDDPVSMSRSQVAAGLASKTSSSQQQTPRPDSGKDGNGSQSEGGEDGSRSQSKGGEDGSRSQSKGGEDGSGLQFKDNEDGSGLQSKSGNDAERPNRVTAVRSVDDAEYCRIYKNILSDMPRLSAALQCSFCHGESATLHDTMSVAGFLGESNDACSCHRCGVYYCSQACRTNDWHVHQFVCSDLRTAK